MKKRILSMLLVLTVAITMMLGSGVCAFAAVTGVRTPASGATKWAVKPGGSMTPPTLSEDGKKLYVASGKYVYMINTANGAIMGKSGQLAASLGYTTVPLTCAEGKVFVPVTGGRVDILNASSLSRIRTMDAGLSGQTITPVTCHNGYLYTGTYNPSGSNGTYLCIDSRTGKSVWKQENPHGYYWAGACFVNGYAIFGSEDGQPDGKTGTAKLYSHPASNDGETKELSLSGSGDIRSTIVYDSATDCVYFTSKAGYFYKVKVEGDGSLTQKGITNLNGASTSTPIISGGKAYVGVNGSGSLAGTGNVKAVDLNTMLVTGSAKTPGYVQGEMLLSTAYGSPYLYAAYNYPPGGITRINASNMTASSFFTPGSTQRQYGLSRVICDSSGTIYYTNDSNYLMAVSSPVRITSAAGKGGRITGSQTVGSGAPSCKFTATPNKYYYVSALSVDGANKGAKTSYTFYNITSDHKIKASFKKVATPTKVKAAAGKKKATVKWKKTGGVNGYQVYRADSKNGKYKKVKTIKKAKTTKFTNKKLKKGKKYYFKVRAYKKANGKTVYGAFSKKVKAKIK